MTGASLADIAVALKKQAAALAAQTAEVEQVAIQIGLSPGSVGRVIFETRRQAELIGHAHRIIKALAEAA